MVDASGLSMSTKPEEQSRSSVDASRHQYSQRSRQTTTLPSQSQGSGGKTSPTHRHTKSGPSGSLLKSPASTSMHIPTKRSRTTSLQEFLEKPNPSSSRRTLEGHIWRTKHLKSEDTQGRRDIHAADFGLGLLDDPFHNDYLLQAQIAELRRRVEQIDPVSFPTLSSPTVTTVESTSRSRPPHPRQTFESVDLTSEPKAGDPEQTHDDPAFVPRLSGSRHAVQRRHIGEIFSEMKEKALGRHKERAVSQYFDDTSQALRYLQAETRIRAYREALHPSTIERARATKAQLGRRYALIYSALACREQPPSLLDVIKWRKSSSELRHSTSQQLIAPGSTFVIASPKGRTPSSGQLPLSTAEEVQAPSPYIVESQQLQWLPHLSVLHQKFLQPFHGRKEMIDWHVTAQVVSDYVQRDLSMDDRLGEHYHGSLYAQSLSPSSSRHVYNTSAQGLERRIVPGNSLDRVAPDNPSGRKSYKGFRLSLSGIQALPKAVGSRASLSSPPLPRYSQDLSPSSSRRELRTGLGLKLTRTHLSEGPDISDFSGSDGEGDGNVISQDDSVFFNAVRPSISRKSTQLDQFQSASDDDPNGNSKLLRKLRPASMSRSNSRKWLGPLMARLAPLTSSVAAINVQIADDPQSPVEDESKKLVGGLKDHAFTADLVSRFHRRRPSLGSADEKRRAIRRERMEMRQRDLYSIRASLVQQLQLQNHNINSSTASALTGVATYVQLKMLMDSTLGIESDDTISDLLHAFAPVPDSALSNGPHGKHPWADVEARHRHRQENLVRLQRFFDSTDGSLQHPWLHSVPIHEPAAGVVVIAQAATNLEDHWASVSKELEDLRALQAEVTKNMSRVIPFCEAVAMQIDTTYPELGRNIDLARQLSTSSQSTLPYISSLPPWAREVLAPVIEYTLELIGLIIRWLLYPIWRVLPRWARVALAFMAVIALSGVVIIFSLIGKYWNLSYSLGLWLSKFAAFRYPVLGIIYAVQSSIGCIHRSWKTVAFMLSLTVFWYITTPQGLTLEPH